MVRDELENLRKENELLRAKLRKINEILMYSDIDELRDNIYSEVLEISDPKCKSLLSINLLNQLEQFILSSDSWEFDDEGKVKFTNIAKVVRQFKLEKINESE